MAASNKTSKAIQRMVEQQQAAERYVAGCLLLESSAIYRVLDILQPDCFLLPQAKLVFQAVTGVMEEGRKPDLLSVTQRLMQDGTLEDAGGAYTLSQYSANVSSTVNLEEHAMFIRQCSTRRKLIDAGSLIQSLGMDVSEDVSDQVGASVKAVEEIMADMDYADPMHDMKESTDRALAAYEQRERLNLEGRPYGLKSGIRILDKYLHGFRSGQLIVVGARPGMGKTSLLLHFAKSIAIEGGQVAIFSLEMNDVSLTNRLVLSLADIDDAAFKDGRLTDGERQRMLSAMGTIRQWQIHIDETPNLSVQQVKVRAMNLKRKSGLGIVMIDYLQLMNMRSDNRQYNREQEIAQTTRRLKQLAKDLEVPVILLSQLNRNIEQKLKDGKMTTTMPQLSDLRESGAIEQDADVVLLIHRPEYYGDTDAIPGVGLINIAKQRDGKTGKVKFSYNESLTRIGDVEDNLQSPF